MNEHVHDYESQLQGQNNKVFAKAHFVYPDKIEDTVASLYRPVTKKGDPRIWFRNLKKYCSPYNLLALVVMSNEIYVFNLSNVFIRESFISHGDIYQLIYSSQKLALTIAEELLAKLQDIHALGYLPSVTKGDSGVGDTLEHALGISRNNSKLPDYKGIELKTWRCVRNGKKKDNRSTLLLEFQMKVLLTEKYWKNMEKFRFQKAEINQDCSCMKLLGQQNLMPTISF